MKNEESKTSTMEILFSIEGISIVRYMGTIYSRLTSKQKSRATIWTNSWVTDFYDFDGNCPNLELILELENKYEKKQQ